MSGNAVSFNDVTYSIRLPVWMAFHRPFTGFPLTCGNLPVRCLPEGMNRCMQANQAGLTEKTAMMTARTAADGNRNAESRNAAPANVESKVSAFLRVSCIALASACAGVICAIQVTLFYDGRQETAPAIVQASNPVNGSANDLTDGLNDAPAGAPVLYMNGPHVPAFYGKQEGQDIALPPDAVPVKPGPSASPVQPVRAVPELPVRTADIRMENDPQLPLREIALASMERMDRDMRAAALNVRHSVFDAVTAAAQPAAMPPEPGQTLAAETGTEPAGTALARTAQPEAGQTAALRILAVRPDIGTDLSAVEAGAADPAPEPLDTALDIHSVPAGYHVQDARDSRPSGTERPLRRAAETPLDGYIPHHAGRRPPRVLPASFRRAPGPMFAGLSAPRRPPAPYMHDGPVWDRPYTAGWPMDAAASAPDSPAVLFPETIYDSFAEILPRAMPEKAGILVYDSAVQDPGAEKPLWSERADRTSGTDAVRTPDGTEPVALVTAPVIQVTRNGIPLSVKQDYARDYPPAPVETFRPAQTDSAALRQFLPPAGRGAQTMFHPDVLERLKDMDPAQINAFIALLHTMQRPGEGLDALAAVNGAGASVTWTPPLEADLRQSGIPPLSPPPLFTPSSGR